MHKLNKPKQVKPMSLSHWYNTVGLISCTMLGLVSLCLVLPFVTNASSALDGSDYNKPAWIPSNYVSLSLDSMPAMDITPTGEGGSVGVSQASLKVSTTSNTGYKLYVSTLDHTTAMTSTDTNQSAAIASTNTIATASNLAPNTWGYTITDAVSDSTTYSPMPTTSTIAYDTAQASGEHYLSFAAKIDTSLPAGQYSNTVAISAIANPAVITGMMELTYMQDMTSSICHDTVGYDQNYNRDSNGSYIITPGSEVTKQLIDSRDGKEYWVAKLADGNCWMTQNLALDLNEKTLPLKPETSDVNGEWRPESYTETSVPNKETYSDQQFWKTRSWNLGKFILATPTRIVSCNTAPVSGSNFDDGTVSAYSGQSIGQNCSNLVDVSGVNWQSTFDSAESPDGVWSGTNYNSTTKKVESYTYTGPLAVNKNTSEYDAHYLIGNFYQWNAAVAGTGGADVASTGAEKDTSKLAYANDSICPKGWKLPRTARDVPAGTPFNMNNLGFHWLTHMYGYPDNGFPNEPTITDDGIDSWKMSGGQLVTKLKTGIAGTGAAGVAHEDVTLSPIYITRSGTVDVVNGIYRGSGYWVIEWSSVAYVNNQAAYQWFLNGDYITPAHANARQGGFNVRCLAK